MIAQHHRSRVVSATVLGLLPTVALTACTGTDQTGSAPTVSSQYAGPWAAELTTMHERFPSEFADAVFADSTITEQEMLEGKQLIESCYTAAGYTVTFDEYGNAAVDDPGGSGDAPPQAMGRCSAADGGVMILYYMVALNPDNEDEMSIRAQCLVREGVVEKGFTGEDLKQAYDTETMPWSDADDAARQCLIDPLGVVGSSTTG